MSEPITTTSTVDATIILPEPADMISDAVTTFLSEPTSANKQAMASTVFTQMKPCKYPQAVVRTFCWLVQGISDGKMENDGDFQRSVFKAIRGGVISSIDYQMGK